MSLTATELKCTPGAGVLDPLNLIGYACWIAVAYGPLSGLVSGAIPWTPVTQAGIAGLLGMLILFTLRSHQQKRGDALIWQQFNTVAQALAALVSCWAFHDGLQPVLMVIIASQATAVFASAAMAAFLLPVNLVMTVLLVNYPIMREPPKLQLSAMYWGLQIFAMAVWFYWRRDRGARIELQRINLELMATRHLLEEGARAEERLRLSRELHDVAGHKLTALKLQLAAQARNTVAAEPAVLADCYRLADELLSDIRGVVSTLRSHEGVDLHSALRALDPGLASPRIEFELDRELRIADMRRAQALLRCAQEGVTNALRHSGATLVRLSLARSDGELSLSVADNGPARSAPLLEGNGLRGVRERLEEIGGRLELRELASGLELRAILPYAAA